MSFKRKPPAGDVRRVRSHGDNLRGVITNKAGRLVQFESWLERALILRLDRDPAVLDYQSQPETFTFVDDQGKVHRYTPDFKVWRQSGVIEIHEVTMSHRRQRVEIWRREQAARAICRERGWQYVLHTEQSLPQGAEQANLLALAGYRPVVYAHQGVSQAVWEQLVPHRPVALAGLVQHLGRRLYLTEGVVMAALGHLLWHGELLTDFNRLLFDEGTIVTGVQVWRATEEGQDEQVG
jgi:hypothetical protein